MKKCGCLPLVCTWALLNTSVIYFEQFGRVEKLDEAFDEVVWLGRLISVPYCVRGCQPIMLCQWEHSEIFIHDTPIH